MNPQEKSDGKKIAKIIGLTREVKTLRKRLESLKESSEHIRRLESNLAFWKRHYYHSQNQLTENGITPHIHVNTLGIMFSEKYEFWKVEQMANCMLKVELANLRRQAQSALKMQ